MALSQSDILAEVAIWDNDVCQEKLSDTLPKILERLKNSSTSADDKITTINVLCHKLLPCIKVKDTEKILFCKLSCEIKALFNDCLAFIDECLENSRKNQEKDKQFVCNNVNGSLTKIYSLLECVETCIVFVLSFNEIISIGDISSLPECVLHLVEGTYRHCKESGDKYKDFQLELFSEMLSMMFKKSHSIQINFLSLMDKLELPNAMTDHNVHIINSVCMGLFKICQTVTSLDMKLVVSLWKSISRLVVQYIQFIGEVVNVTAMIVYLCEEVKTGYQYLLQQLPNFEEEELSWNKTDEKTFQKSVKIIGFELKILISFCKEYLEFLDESKTDIEIYKLLIFIYKNSPQWSEKKIGPEHTDDISRQVVVTCEPLLSNFIERPLFRNCLLGPLKIEDEDSLAQLVMLTSVTKSFSKMSDESQDDWMGISKPYEVKHDDIIDTMFNLIGSCHGALSDSSILLPGIMCSGAAQQFVSLYEFTATHICGFIGSLLNKYFPILEASLLKRIFSENCHIRMLAIDCWCFMDRYGCSDLCRNHVEFFVDMFQRYSHFHPVLCEDNSMSIMIVRLIRFLEPDDQTKLMTKYSNPVNVTFWCICPVNASQLLPQQNSIIMEVVTYCASQINNWAKSTNHLVSSVSNIILSCGALNNILYSGLEVQLLHQMDIIAEKLSLVWNVLCLSKWDQSLQMDSFLSILLKLLPFIQIYLTDVQLVEIFLLLKHFVSQKPTLLLLTGIVKFIDHCSSLTFSSEEIPVILEDIIILILNNQNCLISHMAMETITCFAEKTKYGEIIPNCLKRDQNIEQHIVNFINKVLVTDLNLKQYLKNQSVKLKTENKLTWLEELNQSRESEITVRPTNKRARLEDGDEDLSFENLLKNVESDWSEFETLAVSRPVPDWFKISAKVICEKFLKKIK